MPLIDVLMPARDAARTVSIAVRSLEAQTEPDWRLILVDDGSTDDTVELASAACRSDRLHVLTHSSPCGVATSLNDALAHADARFIARLDADDVSRPDRLAAQLAAFAADPALDATCSGVRVIDEGGRSLPTARLLGDIGSDDMAMLLLLTNPVCHSSVMVRRSSMQPYPTDQPLEDYASWLANRRRWRWRFLAAELAEWRLHQGNITSRNQDPARELLSPLLAAECRSAGFDVSDRLARVLQEDVVGAAATIEELEVARQTKEAMLSRLSTTGSRSARRVGALAIARWRSEAVRSTSWRGRARRAAAVGAWREPTAAARQLAIRAGRFAAQKVRT